MDEKSYIKDVSAIRKIISFDLRSLAERFNGTAEETQKL